MINTFTRRINKNRLAMVIVFSTTLTACTGMLNPYIYPPKSARVASSDLAATHAAIKEIDTTNDDIKSHLNTRAVSGRLLNAATFGLTVGLGVNLATGAALADKSTTLLALGAGSTYGASQLFFPKTTEGAYLSAYTALSCVANRANLFTATYVQATTITGNDVNNLPETCKINNTALNESINYLNAIIQKSKDADQIIGLKITTTENNVLMALNTQLLNDTPDPDKVLAAAKNSLAIAAGFTKPQSTTQSVSDSASPNGKTTARSRKRPTPPKSPPNCPSETAINQQIEINNAAAKALTDQLNAMGTPGSGCQASDQQGAAKMSVPQTVVMISPEEQQSIPVTGGLPEISWRWENDAAPGADELSVELNNATRILKLTGQKKKLAKDYTLLLTDKSVVPQQLAIQIKGG